MYEGRKSKDYVGKKVLCTRHTVYCNELSSWAIGHQYCLLLVGTVWQPQRFWLCSFLKIPQSYELVPVLTLILPLLRQVKLSLRDDPAHTLGSTNIHHHHRQHHPPPPSSCRSYDSPSSSSPASSNNDPPPPISHSAATFTPLPPPLAHHFNSSGKLQPLGVPQPPPVPKLSSFGSITEAAVHSPVVLPSATMVACRKQEEATEDGPVEDPSMRSFLGKIKAFEKMDHFARARRILDVQEAQNARVGAALCFHWSSVVSWGV